MRLGGYHRPEKASVAGRSSPEGQRIADRCWNEENGQELDVPVFDFAKLFPSNPELYVGAVHNTDEGSRLKAGMFADFLETSGLLPDGK